VQSPVISLVRVSSPMYWPSNLATPCAHATLPSPVPSRRPSRRHLSIPFFPMIKADGETIEGISDETVPGILPALAPMQGDRADALTDPMSKFAIGRGQQLVANEKWPRAAPLRRRLFHGDLIQYIVARTANIG